MGDLQMAQMAALAKVPKALWPLLMNAAEVGRFWVKLLANLDQLATSSSSSLRFLFERRLQMSYLDSVDVEHEHIMYPIKCIPLSL